MHGVGLVGLEPPSGSPRPRGALPGLFNADNLIA